MTTPFIEEAKKLLLQDMPEGTRIAYYYKGKFFLLGTPAEDGDHNCDAMGCPTVGDHVLVVQASSETIDAVVKMTPKWPPLGAVVTTAPPIKVAPAPDDSERQRRDGDWSLMGSQVVGAERIE